VNPILSANREEPYTLEEALKEVGDATEKLNRFGMIHATDRLDSSDSR
jgi:outer membrane protein insertion porin family